MANPYPGPRPFQKGESGIFAGRDHEVSELTSLIVSHQVVVLYAQSGAGKTSIVNAGLSNSLSERGIRLLPIARVGVPVPREIPLDEIANVYTFSMAWDILPGIAVSEPWRRQATPVDVFSRLPDVPSDSTDRSLSVCVLDQFEELFSAYPDRWPDREKFFLDLSALLEARRDVRVLFVLREDFLAAFSGYAALLPEGGRTRYRIERLREQEAISAILKPLDGTGHSFAPDVAETIVHDLMRITVASRDGGVTGVRGEFVEPVQLQVVCYSLFAQLPESTTTVTLETYRQYGDPDNALETFYKQALDATIVSTGVDERELREWFERKLITPAGTRGLVFQDEQGTAGMSNDVVQVLDKQHVIRPEIRSGFRWYELTHDRFIRPIQRSNAAWRSDRASRSFDPRYSDAIRPLSDRAGIPTKDLREVDEPLRITVTNGDLTFEQGPLLLGHYRATQLTGTEKVIDRLVGGTMTRSLETGIYPASIGSHQIFINTRPNLERGSFMPRPKAVIIVGLGDEGRLRAVDLVHSVRQAVVAWAERVTSNRKHAPPVFELAATLMGSGGSSIGAGDSARLVSQGVYEANVLLQNDGNRTRPKVSRLQFVELYLDRATEAWRALRMQAAVTPNQYVIDDSVKAGTGPLQRPPDSGYRGSEFDLMRVGRETESDGTPTIAYTLDTRRARVEIRGQRAESVVISDLIATASNYAVRDKQIGRTLFNLLIPIELEPYLAAGSGETQIEVDSHTAKIPWELLHTNNEGDSQTPWAIRVKLVRKLRIGEYQERSADAGPETSALVIGEPECPSEYPRLFGARGEALAVRGCLAGDATLTVTDLISEDFSQPGPTARDVINALFDKSWRIVHIAGNGAPGRSGAPGGVVLSNGTFLGPAEFGTMRTLPDLVFVNCCHLGAADSAQLLYSHYDRAQFASGFAGALIAIGVRCVVAAGWAVDDDAASVFAEEFYRSLLRGNRFIVAVGEARAAAHDRSPNVNTWAAYQCYGDPDWVFRGKAADPNHVTAPPTEDVSGIGSATALKLALERIVVRTRYQGADVAEQLRSLAQLEKLFGSKWGRSGDVAELFGEALVEAGDVEAGIQWYETAVAAPDGRASIKAAEQLANVRGRLGWEIVDHAARELDEKKKGEKASGQGTRARAAARRARMDAERSLRKAIIRAERLIDHSLELLTRVIALESTVVRASLIGSAYKRMALVNGVAGRHARVQQALKRMRMAYAQAQKLGEKSGIDVYYMIANQLTADVALHAGTLGWRGPDRETINILRKSLEAKGAIDPDFWSVVGETELDQYEALAARKLALARKQLSRAYEDLHKRVTATRMWASVYDTAYLVLPNYARRTTGKEKAAANELLAQLRLFAHPDDDR